MNCMICKEKCEGNLTIVHPLLKPTHYKVCSICFNLWTNQDYDNLEKRIPKEIL